MTVKELRDFLEKVEDNAPVLLDVISDDTDTVKDIRYIKNYPYFCRGKIQIEKNALIIRNY